VKQCTMNCGQAMWDKRSREQMMAECDDCVTEPCNPAEDGVCEALECRLHEQKEHWVEQWSEVCHENQTLLNRIDSDTALLRQCLEALEWCEPAGTTGHGGIEARKQAIAALKERLT